MISSNCGTVRADAIGACLEPSTVIPGLYFPAKKPLAMLEQGMFEILSSATVCSDSPS